MQNHWTTVRLTATAAVVLALPACGSFAISSASGSHTEAAMTSTAATGVANARAGTSTPAFRTAPEPSFVATDPPQTLAPNAPRSVLITYSGWVPDTRTVEVGGYVAGVIESDGTCTLTLSQGGRSVTTSKPGEVDASSTSCGGLSIPAAQVSSGSWTAVLTYASTATRATSAPVRVQVP
jgi:hypothetical protein